MKKIYLLVFVFLFIYTALIYPSYYDKVKQNRQLTHYINTQEEADKLFIQTKELVYKVIGIRVYGSIKLKILPAEEMDKLLGNNPYKGVELGFYRYESDGHHIYMAKDLLNKDAFIGVLAHEYTHAWQTENCPYNQTLALKEGLAQWVAYKVLNYIKAYNEASRIYFMTDPVYGVGFKKVLKMEDKLGKDELIKKVKNITDFPQDIN